MIIMLSLQLGSVNIVSGFWNATYPTLINLKTLAGWAHFVYLQLHDKMFHQDWKPLSFFFIKTGGP